MMDTPFISVIIPTYNRKEVIGRAIDSVLKQSYSNYEIIVVDDCSSDQSAEYISKNFPQVKLIRLASNSGASEARNVGIVNSNGDFISFLDSDDEWDHDFLKEHCAMMDHDTVLTYCNFKQIDINGSVRFSNTKPDKQYSDLVHNMLMYNFIRTMSIVTVKRSAIADSGMFDKRLSITHDRDIYLRLLGKGKFFHLNKNLVCRHILNDGLTRDYKNLGKDLFITFNNFFKSTVGKNYKHLEHIVKSNAACEVARVSLSKKDYSFAIRMYLKSLLISMRDTKTFKILLNKFALLTYNRLIPGVVKQYIISIIKPRLIERSTEYVTPTQIILFVTSKCNLRCKHCFYWNELSSKTYDMSIADISKLASSFKLPTDISLTGGEPFLRKDLLEICDVLIQSGNIKNINLNTNGFASKIIVTSCKQILNSLGAQNLSVIISLDGLAKTHDAIRGVSGCFESVIETILELSKLKSECSNFNLQVLTVIMKDNYHEIPEIIDYVKRFDLKHKFSFMRGGYSTFHLPKSLASDFNPEEEKSHLISINEMKEIVDLIIEKNNQLEVKFLSELQEKKLLLSIDIMRKKKRVIPCYSGKINGVIYSNGDVAFCEHIKPIGNLKDYYYDFNKLWNSDKANIMRNQIKKCECLYGCMLTTSLSVKPIYKIF